MAGSSRLAFLADRPLRAHCWPLTLPNRVVQRYIDRDVGCPQRGRVTLMVTIRLVTLVVPLAIPILVAADSFPAHTSWGHPNLEGSWDFRSAASSRTIG